MTRIMGLSTALANPYDLADWIGIDTQGHGSDAKRGLYNFRPSVRPVPMVVHVSRELLILFHVYSFRKNILTLTLLYRSKGILGDM